MTRCQHSAMACKVKESRIQEDGAFMIEEQMLTFQLDVDVETRGQGVKIWE